jgi:hypothetical protein
MKLWICAPIGPEAGVWHRRLREFTDKHFAFIRLFFAMFFLLKALFFVDIPSHREALHAHALHMPCTLDERSPRTSPMSLLHNGFWTGFVQRLIKMQ